MVEGGDYRITKLEKGPLQRFKNQNLLLKKFGEVGLQIYKAITGKRTTKELRKDLGVDEALFGQVLDYMQSMAMVDLQPVEKRGAKEEIQEKEIEEKTPPAEIAPEELPPEEETPSPTLEELPPEEELVKEEETPPLEEKPRKKPSREPEEEKPPFDEAISFEDEIKPIEFEETRFEEEKPKKKEEPPPKEEKEEEKEEEEAPPMPEKPERSDLSPIEKIISDKYGDIGLRVYALIDGQRTAEEIMRDTGLTEAKLVEILDFMDEQGIIKLDYPKAPPPPPSQPQVGPMRGPTTRAAPPPPAQAKKGGVSFTPMLEAEEAVEEGGPVPSPLEQPMKAPLDIVKTVQMKARIMLKYGDKGGRILEQIDGKNDVIDISLKLDMPLYTVLEILNYLMENGMVLMKPLPRLDVRRKYGDDGYAVYKKYGKEGLMLYELIGKELTIKQMADRITTDKAKIIDMFIFIHKVLGIELPIDKDMLAKQLGV